MDTISIDTYAATNPAFCSLVLHSFFSGYVEADETGLPLPLVILPLPIVLSEDIASTLGPTNVSTGLLPWVVRNQQITVGLLDRITMSSNFTQQALLFGLRFRIIGVNSIGRLVPDKTGLAKKPSFLASTNTGRAIRFATRLGRWMGEVREVSTIFISLGVNR